MKKTLLSCSIVLLLFAFFFTGRTFAQTSTQTTEIDYTLPYPGILPDNPLYGLKTLRDKFIAFFISDPLKKAEFDLLQFDKRLSIAIALFDKGEKDLAEQTISKGENYFEDGIKNLQTIKRGGESIDPNLLTNMELSSKKHVEIIKGFRNRTDNGLRKRFSADLESANKFVSNILEFKP